MTGARYAIALGSATAGMHLLLAALGVREGDEIITPSMTFASTVNMIALLGAKPVFVDIDYGTLNMDAGLLEEKVTARTRAIIPVHFGGAPVDMDKIRAVAERHGLLRHRRCRRMRSARTTRKCMPGGSATRRFSPFIRSRTLRLAKGA